MSESISILMAQINLTTGAIKKNTQQVIDIILSYQNSHQLIIFPELTLTGYSPKDWLFHEELYQDLDLALARIQQAVNHCYVLIGHPFKEESACYNSASIFYQNQIIKRYHKQRLPNYGVFDEKRYFTEGPAIACTFDIHQHRFGLCICEDIWQKGPVEQLIEAKIDTLLVMNASPFEVGKMQKRLNLLQTLSKQNFSIVYVNHIGGQDELVFDGCSVCIDSKGEIAAMAQAFQEDLASVEISKQLIQGHITKLPQQTALIYQALCLALRDYMQKSGFNQVVIGLSGGIDSALTLAIAVDTLGANNVHAVLMPSCYTRDMSIQDAIEQANNMNVTYSNFSIEPAKMVLLETLSPLFNGHHHSLTEENLQARIRGILLMALSNYTNALVLNTSNKSETAVGYSTLYGDMCGGFAVLKDVLKTQVYQLALYRNSINEVIPTRVIERAPSAELAPNQKDEDSLPPYNLLDPIIHQYMTQHVSKDQLVLQGFDKKMVSKVIDLIKRNEYKRKQAAIGVKISTCAFDGDWRYPIVYG